VGPTSAPVFARHRKAWTVAAFADDVIAAIDALELQSAVLVGHSTGGNVIVEAALRLGDRVKGLVWVDTYRPLGEPAEPAETEAFVDPFRRDFVGATRDFVRRALVPPSDPDLVE
jgi:pimeloyl-ACP methyl ester carboxylesterase